MLYINTNYQVCYATCAVYWYNLTCVFSKLYRLLEPHWYLRLQTLHCIVSKLSSLFHNLLSITIVNLYYDSLHITDIYLELSYHTPHTYTIQDTRHICTQSQNKSYTGDLDTRGFLSARGGTTFFFVFLGISTPSSSLEESLLYS